MENERTTEKKQVLRNFMWAKLEKSKMGIFLSNRAFYVFLSLLILLGAGIGWYFGDRIFG